MPAAKTAAAETKPPSVADYVELLALVELNNVIIYEERAKRPTGTPGPDDPEYVNSMAIAQTDATLEFRFRSQFSDEHGTYVADIAAQYVMDEPFVVVDKPILFEFARQVAFMSVYPFVRASIFASAGRLGNPSPVLALVRRGEFELGEELTPEEVKSIFVDGED